MDRIGVGIFVFDCPCHKNKKNNFCSRDCGFGNGWFIFGVCWQQYQYEQNSNFAIVFAPNVYIKSAPDEQSTDLFILHEGIKVEIIDKVGEWQKLRLADGKVGWIKEEAAEGI